MVFVAMHMGRVMQEDNRERSEQDVLPEPRGARYLQVEREKGVETQTRNQNAGQHRSRRSLHCAEGVVMQPGDMAAILQIKWGEETCRGCGRPSERGAPGRGCWRPGTREQNPPRRSPAEASRLTRLVTHSVSHHA